MEYLEGETLADAGRARCRLTQALKGGVEIGDAFDKAHRKAVAHRDLKPSNIMVTKSGAKLMDFGLAKPSAPRLEQARLGFTRTMSKPLTVEGTILGTFQYMSPEQVERKD